MPYKDPQAKLDYQREYNKTPKAKAYNRDYHQRPEVKARRAAKPRYKVVLRKGGYWVVDGEQQA